MAREMDRAWREVGRSVEELGSQIREHFRRQVEERGQTPDQTGRGMADALEALSRQVGSAFDTLGQTLRDETVREQALRASRAFADAVEASVADLGGRVRKGDPRSSGRRDR
jgi:hypothetical protein